MKTINDYERAITESYVERKTLRASLDLHDDKCLLRCLGPDSLTEVVSMGRGDKARLGMQNQSMDGEVRPPDA